MKTIEQWREFIAAGRDKTMRKCANNTVVFHEAGGIGIKLHATTIVILRADGTYQLNTGGWQTVTTKERLNCYSPARISQKAGVWYMNDGSLFYDGIVINSDGTPVKPKSPAKTAAYEKKLKAIKKDAKAYAKGFVVALEAGAVDYPSGGDCWACSMRGPEGQECFKGSGHIRDHINENYFVPSLLVNAGRAAGYRDEQIGLMGIGGHRVIINPERNIYKYVVKQLQGEL